MIPRSDDAHTLTGHQIRILNVFPNPDVRGTRTSQVVYTRRGPGVHESCSVSHTLPEKHLTKHTREFL